MTTKSVNFHGYVYKISLKVCCCRGDSNFNYFHCNSFINCLGHLTDRKCAHYLISKLILVWTKHAVMSFCVALILRWKRDCNELRIILQNIKGTYGQEVPVDTSQSSMTTAIGTGMGLSDKEVLPCINCCKWESSYCCEFLKVYHWWLHLRSNSI